MSGTGVDLHPYYQRGAQITRDVSFAWVKMADGARVYAMKADGKTWTADEHARRLRAADVPFGGYVYAQPGDGGAEARVLWAECQRLGGTGVAPSCDIESNKNIYTWSVREATDHGRAFCSAMRRLGVRPAVYMDLTLLRDCRPDRWPEDPVIWAPRYGAKPEQLLHGVQYTGRYDVHQYTSSGSLPGSAGLVDWNQAYSTAHLIGEDDMPLNDADKAFIAQTVRDTVRDTTRFAVLATEHDPNNLDASTNTIWTFGGRNLVDILVQILANTFALLAKTGGASAEEIAAALLPALSTAMVEELRAKDAISDEDAEQIAKAVTDRAGALLRPITAPAVSR